MIYLVCFDVTENKVRNRLVKVLLNYGRRIQYSVFELDLCATYFRKFELDFFKIKLDKNTDKCFIYPLNAYSLENTIYLGEYEKVAQVYVF